MYQFFHVFKYLTGWPSGLRRLSSNREVPGSNPAQEFTFCAFWVKISIFNCIFTPLRTGRFLKYRYTFIYDAKPFI